MRKKIGRLYLRFKSYKNERKNLIHELKSCYVAFIIINILKGDCA